MGAIDDSYEGAVRRLRRLEQDRSRDARPLPRPAVSAPLPVLRPEVFASPDTTRLRDLEHLAVLACDENERLERELRVAREENAHLRRRVEALEVTIADPRAVLGLSPLPIGEETPVRRLSEPRRCDGSLLATAVVLGLVFGPIAYVVSQPVPRSAFGMLERAPLAAMQVHLDAAIAIAIAKAEPVFHGPIPMGWLR